MKFFNHIHSQKFLSFNNIFQGIIILIYLKNFFLEEVIESNIPFLNITLNKQHKHFIKKFILTYKDCINSF